MKRFFVISTVLLWVGGFILAVCATTASAEKPINLTITVGYAPGSQEDIIARNWAKRIEKDSNGRVKFQVFTGGVLVGTFETYFAIPKGVADLGIGYRYGKGAPFTDTVLGMALAGTPDAFTTLCVIEALRKEFAEYYEKEWPEVKILWIFGSPPGYFVTTKPVRTLEDFQGLQLRVPIKYAAAATEALGGKPVAVSLSDLVVGLQKGTVDGGTACVSYFKPFNLAPAAKYCIEFSFYGATSGFMVMNKDKWNSLPPDIKRIFETASEWGKLETARVFSMVTQDSKKWAMKQGMEFISLKPEEKKRWTAIRESTYLRLAKEYDAQGYPATKAFRFAQDQLALYTD
jgi:TRAP-type C4-dicarboxylate transport system substrate-binding protein